MVSESGEVMKCILCQSDSFHVAEFRDVSIYQCQQCHSVFKDPSAYVSRVEEDKVYQSHNNDIHDPRYLAFVSPIIHEIQQSFSIDSLGLDFGCGSGPIVSHHLAKSGYTINLYDPLFYPDTWPLQLTYDYIVCSEVMEHFKQPYIELEHLFSKLKPQGKLICMTDIYHSDTDFSTWYYLKDPTHIFFVSSQTIHWIATTFHCSVAHTKRLIVFTKNQ